MLRYVSAAEVVALYGCTRAEVYRLANKDKWRRVRDNQSWRQALYHHEDVRDTFIRLVKVKKPVRVAT